MLITETKLRSIIRHSLKEAYGIDDVLLLEEKTKKSSVLVDTPIGRGTVSFGSLLERMDTREISAHQVGIILETDLRQTRIEIINEGLLDAISDAYESVKGGALKLKDKISDTAAAAMKKINEKYIQWTTKIWMAAQKGKEYAMQALGLIEKGLDAISKFKKKHPILYRIICVILAMIVIAIVTSLLSNAAEAGAFSKNAASQAQPEGVSLDQDTVDQVYGCMKKVYKHAAPGGDGYQYDNSHDAIRDAAMYFKKAASGGQTFDPTTMGEHANTCMDTVKKLQDISQIGDGSSEAAQVATESLDGFVGLANKIFKDVGAWNSNNPGKTLTW